MRNIFLILSLLIFSCDEEELVVHGCLDSQACNYNSTATIDNNSCIYVSDCNGECGSDAVEDNCGTCDTDASNDCVQDCAETWGGDLVNDECGVCDGDGMLDCGTCPIDGYNSNDICVLQNLIDLNNDLAGMTPFDIAPTDLLADQRWENGRLVRLYLLTGLGEKIHTFPENIGDLTALKKISFNDGFIESLPESFGDLISLEDFTLQNQPLASLPESIGQLSQLYHLYISNNQLTNLPNSFGDLNLEILNLSNNQLTSLPLNFCDAYGGGGYISVSDNNLCEEYYFDCISGEGQGGNEEGWNWYPQNPSNCP